MTTTTQNRKKPKTAIDTKPFKWLNETVNAQTKAERKAFRAQAKTVTSIADLVALLKIEHWDYFIIGDGSGTRWEHPGGWTSLLIGHTPPIFEWFYGSLSHSTNIVAELMAYVHPLLWLAARDKDPHPRNVHIVTDCEHLVENWPRPGRWKANKHIWQLLGAMPRQGLRLHFHWIPRDSVPANQFCDELAGLSRLTAVGLKDELPRLTKKYLEPKPCDTSEPPATTATSTATTSTSKTTRRKKKSRQPPTKPSSNTSATAG